MRLFILVFLNILVFIPLTSLATDGKKNPLNQNHKKTAITVAQKADAIKAYGNLPLYFIENKGQVDGQVSFYEKGAGHATFFTRDGLVLSLTKREDRADKALKQINLKDIEINQNPKLTTEAVSLSFVEANKKAEIIAGEKKSGRINYFIGNDKTKWRSNIPTYGALTYKDIYKNIDIKFYGNNKNIEHDVIVRPGGDFSEVIFTYRGVKGLKVTEAGDLEVSLKNGKLLEQKPVIYQEIKGQRVAVDGSYRILKEKDGVFAYGFTVASYDKTKKLVIDPVLVYSTYLGGSGSEWGHGIAVDASGAAYVTGETTSTDFPLMNPIQGTFLGAGTTHAFVTKINTAGTAIVYSTYLGGSSSDYSYAIAVDTIGQAYVTGLTNSTDFPLMAPIQSTLGGGADAFVTKINRAGSALLYSTYLGGTTGEIGYGIAVDDLENAYVTGKTSSTDFPLNLPLQTTHGGGTWDAFVTEIYPSGSGMAYSTYLGGTGDDIGHGIAVDVGGSAYVTGETWSWNFPTMRPIQGYLKGDRDVFVTKLAPFGVALDYSTYLGGSINLSGGPGAEIGYGIAVDATGAAYVTGWTVSTDFPVITPAFQATPRGNLDAFITKINSGGSAYVYSTYLGGSTYDQGYGIAVDSAGRAYVTGFTDSSDFPLVNPTQGYVGNYSAFETTINPAGLALLDSTYLGGSTGETQGRGIAVDKSGNAYITGLTRSTDFPLMNPIQGTSAGSYDTFITRMASGGGPPPPPVPVITVDVTPDTASVPRGGVLGYSVTLTNTTASTHCFQYWENVTLPGGIIYPAKGSLYNPVPRACFKAGMSYTVHLTHGVPMFAPVGAYVFNAYDGIYPIPYRAVVDTASFNFNVTAFGPLTNHPETSWRLINNGFRN